MCVINRSKHLVAKNEKGKMLNLIFFDSDQDVLNEYEDAIGTDEHTFFVKSDVEEIVESFNIHILIAPTDCTGRIDRSLDVQYHRLFPDGLDDRVMVQIEQFKLETSKGDHILPIGSSTLVPSHSLTTPLILCSAITVSPDEREIVDTYNVYWAFRSILNVLEKVIQACPTENITINVATPCVGVCNLHESVEQIAAARHDFLLRNTAICDPQLSENIEVISRPEEWAYVLSNHACLPKKT